MSNEYKGYNGQILRVDLTTGEITTQKLEEERARKYLGGTGLGVSFLYEEVDPKTNWNDPENILYIGSGTLGGTHVAGSGTISIVTKGAMTNGTCATQGNGLLGAFMRFCGYEAIIFKGAAPDWVYLHLKADGTAEIKDARHIIGKDSWETCDIIKEECGKTRRTMSVCAIGEAGENLVRFAGTQTDKEHQSSSNGPGAVFGSKKLKAVAVEKGMPGFEIFDPEEFQELTNQIHEDLEWTPFGNGTNTALDGGGVPAGGSGLMYNYKAGYDPSEEMKKKLEKFGSTYLRENYEGKLDTTCWACNATHCYSMKIPEGEPFAGEECGEPEVEIMYDYGMMLGNFNHSAALYMGNLGDKLCYDANEAGWVLGMILDMYENGMFTAEDLGGVKMEWGNYEEIIKMMYMIARREGIGDIFAEGATRMAEKWPEAAKYCVGVKNYTTPRAVAFKKSWPYIFDNIIGQGGKNEGLTYMMAPSVLGIECSVGDDYRACNGTREQVVELNANCGWGMHYIDSLGICWFPTNGDMEVLKNCICAVTGWDYTYEEMIETGYRIQNLMRVYNLRCGMTPDREQPMPRMIERIELPDPPYELEDQFDDMLHDYYEAMGWDRETARPLPETLKKYGLEDIIADIW